MGFRFHVFQHDKLLWSKPLKKKFPREQKYWLGTNFGRLDLLFVYKRVGMLENEK